MCRVPSPPGFFAVVLATVVAALSFTKPMAVAAGHLHIADAAPAAAASLNAVVCALAWRRARRTPDESPLWLGVLFSFSLLSVCVPLRAALPLLPGTGTNTGTSTAQLLAVLLALTLTLVIIVSYLLQHAGVTAWHQRLEATGPAVTAGPAATAALDASAPDHRQKPRQPAATTVPTAPTAPTALPSSRPRAVDRHEVLLGLAAVLVTVALLNAAALLAPEAVPSGGGWLAWSALQPPLALIAISLVRAQALLVIARSRGVLGDPRIWLMTTAAITTAAACAADALSTGMSAQALLVPVALLMVSAAAAMDPSRPRRRTSASQSVDSRPSDSQTSATIGSFAVLLVAVGVLAVAAVSHTTVDGGGGLSGRQAPFAATAVCLSVLVAALTATRLLLNLRHLAWSMTSQHEAITDDLTGLLNRRGLLRRLDRACTDGGALGVALIDVDHFKAVNDGLGHAAGDELLRQITQRLQDVPRTFTYERVIARLGGDEFIVLVLPGPGDTPDDVRADHAARARPWGAMLQQSFAAPFDLAGAQVHISASIGLTTLNPSPASPDARSPLRSTSTPQIADADRRPSELLRRVDAAMYEAKGDEQRGRAVIYDPARHDDATHRLRTIEQLRHGIEAGQLVLHYQPQLDAGTGLTSGVEALVRWAHPSRGLLGPAAFLPLAEAHGLMTRLTDVILEQAVKQLETWRDVGSAGCTPAARGLRVSVNLSATSLLDAHLPRRVADLLHTHRVPPHRLVLEVTETVLLRDPERSTAVVGELRELGVELSIDDFGTGYSSLTQLRTLAVHELKLDRAFTFGLGSDPRAAHIVASTVALAHGLGIRVVAEGVEDEATLMHLVGFGCDLTQGYLHARPLPPDELDAWLQARSGVPVPASSTSGATA